MKIYMKIPSIQLYFTILFVGSEICDFQNTASIRGAKRLTVKFRDSDELLPPSKKIPVIKHKIKKKKSEGGELLLWPGFKLRSLDLSSICIYIYYLSYIYIVYHMCENDGFCNSNLESLFKSSWRATKSVGRRTKLSAHGVFGVGSWRKQNLTNRWHRCLHIGLFYSI